MAVSVATIKPLASHDDSCTKDAWLKVLATQATGWVGKVTSPVQIVALIARLLLFGVFVVAGLAKLADKAGARQALVDFGIPLRFAAFLGILLPLAELVTGGALIPVWSARVGALTGLFLLLLFIAGISVNLGLGRAPNCHCFGQLHSKPVGWSTLGRNSVLAGVAGFVAWNASRNSQMSVFGWTTNLSVAQRMRLVVGIAVLTLLAAQCAFLMEVLRQQGRLLLRLDTLESRLPSTGLSALAPQPLPVTQSGLPPGASAPRFELKSLNGELKALDDFLAVKKPALLLFTNPKCGPCQALMPDVARWHKEYASALTITLISEGSAKDNQENLAGSIQVLLQEKREVAERYQAYGTPAAVLIRPDSTIGSFLAQGADAIRALVAQALAASLPAPPRMLAETPSRSGGNGGGGGGSVQRVSVAKVGELMPPLRFPDLSGKSVAFGKLRGRKTLLLFWNPGCGFCQQMLEDLRSWEANRPPDAPELLVISAGTIEANRAMNLRSRIVLDDSFSAGRAFGATGTPMAVLLDADGKVGSEVAAGAAAVFALANSKPSEV